MKKQLMFLLFMHCFLSVCAQDGDVSMAVAMPSDYVLDNNARTILKNRVVEMVTAEGVSADEYGAIAIVPEVSVSRCDHIDGGMRRITSVEMEITMKVVNVITATTFHSMSLTVRGEGYSDSDARLAAIGKISARSAECADFVRTSKNRVSDYYARNTAALIAEANTLAAQQRYDEALALLASYPVSLNGYRQVSDVISSIFTRCQTLYCSQILMSARAAFSRHEYEEAAGLVAMVDAQSSCAKDAASLLKSITSAMDRQMADENRMEKERMLSAERVRTARITAVRDIATAFFKRQKIYIFF